MRTRGMRGAVLLALGLLLSLAIACGGDDEGGDSEPAGSSGGGGGGGSVAVTLEDGGTWAVKAASAKAAAGDVTFKASNKGAAPHELVVVQTDLDVAKLPQAAGQVDEKQVKVLGRTKNVAAGKSEDLKLKLAAGKYALICNIPAHYGQGMHTAFAVE